MSPHHFDEVAKFVAHFVFVGHSVGDLRFHEFSKASPEPVNGDFHGPFGDADTTGRLRLAAPSDIARKPVFEQVELWRFALFFVLSREGAEGAVEHGKSPLSIEPNICWRSVGSREIQTGRTISDGRNRQMLLPAAGDVSGAAWSPDGRVLAVTCSQPGRVTLCLMTPEGHIISTILDEGANFDPAWNPARGSGLPPGVRWSYQHLPLLSK